MGNAVQSTYRMSLPLEQAGLSEEAGRRRERLERWLGEQARGVEETLMEARRRHLEGAVKLPRCSTS